MRGVDPLTASVLDSAAEGALLLDGEHRVVLANDVAARLLDRDRAALEGEVLVLPATPRAMELRWTPVGDAWPDGGGELEASASRLGLEPARTVVWLRRRAAGSGHASALLDDLEALADVGRWVWWPVEDRLEWSAGMHRLYGTTPRERPPSIDGAVGMIHPLDRERAADAIGALGRRGRLEPRRFRIVRPDGDVRTLVATRVVTQRDPTGRPVQVEGWLQDVTAAAVEERLRRVRRAARTHLEGWRGTEDAPALLAAIGEALDVAFAVLWVPRRTLLHAEATWAAPAFDGTTFQTAVHRARVSEGTGYAGTAWATREPVTTHREPPGGRTRTAAAAVAAGLGGGCAIPARTDHHVAAVLTVHTCEAGEVTPSMVSGLVRIADELAREVDRVRLAGRAELSPRELDVLRAIAAGRATAEIATDLGIRVATVRTHVEHVLAKLGTRDRAAAVAFAMRAGVIS